MLELVPLDEKLIARVKIEPKDISHIKVGNEVHIKISAFNFSHYGSLLGSVLQISGSTFLDDPESDPYYEGIIELEKGYFGSNPKENLVLPGMMVTADIVTGKQSILSYIFKPIEDSFSNAFKER